MSEPTYRLIAKAGYSGKSDQDIDNLRSNLLTDYDNAGITGTFIFGEGTGWIDLEGDRSDLKSAYHNLDGGGFFDWIRARDFVEVLDTRLDHVYIYHEDRKAVSSKP